jgi:hypothetical protein
MQNAKPRMKNAKRANTVVVHALHGKISVRKVEAFRYLDHAISRHFAFCILGFAFFICLFVMQSMTH